MSIKYKGRTIAGGGKDYIAGDGIKIQQTADRLEIGVETPVRGVFTQEEFDALPEAERNKGFYVISGGGSEDGSGGDGVPAGFIGIWSGAADSIPSGWALCDGQDGRPDLRDRFILGGGGTHPVGEASGEEKHTLTVDEMPSHAHIVKSNLNATNKNANANVVGNVSRTTVWTDTALAQYAGGSQPHNNMPPYYTLCYIIKL